MSTHEEQNRPNNKPKLLKRIVLGTIAGVFILAIMAEFFLLFFANAIFQKVANNFVKKESKNIYNVSFEGLKIEPFTGYIYMKNFNLIPDSNRYNQLVKNENIKTSLYNISLSELKVRGLSFRKLLFDKTLIIKALALETPMLRILKTPRKANKEIRKLTIIKQDLYQLVSPYFSSVAIDKFDLKQGFFSMNIGENKLLKQTGAEHISFTLRDFLLNAEEYKKKNNLFYSKQIQLDIYNYSLKLNDGIHEVLVKKIELKPNDSIILIENVTLHPAFQNVQNVDNEIFMDTYVSSLLLGGVDIYKAWRKNEINLRHILLLNPSIKIHLPEKQTEKKKKQFAVNKKIDLYKLIKGKLELLSFDTLSIKNASFSVFNKNERIPIYDVRKFNMSTTGFLLDSLSYKRKNKLLLSDDITLIFRGLKLAVMQQSHFLEADSLYASTSEKKLLLKGLNLRPNIKYTKGKPRLEVSLKQISFADLNLTQAINNSYLHIGKINIKSPEIKATTFKKGNEKNETESVHKNVKINRNVSVGISSFFAADFLHKLKIGELQVQNANFEYNSHLQDEIKAFFRADFEVDIHDLVIDRSTLSKSKSFFFANEFDVKMTNFSMKSPADFHHLKIDSVQVSSLDSLVYLSGFNYFLQKNTDTLKVIKKYNKKTVSNIFIQKMIVSGIDLKKALYHKKYLINTIVFKNFNALAQSYFQIKDSIPVQKNSSFQNLMTKQNLYKVLNNVLKDNVDSLKINKLKLDNAHFYHSYTDTFKNIKSYTEGILSTTASNICMKDTALLAYKKFPIAGILNLSISKFKHLNFVKNLSIEVNLLKFLSNDSSFHARNIKVRVGNKKNTKSTKSKIDLTANSLHLRGIGIDELINYKKIKLTDLNLPALYVDLELPAKTTKKTGKILQFKMPKSLKGLNLNTLSIDKGRLTVKNHGSKELLGRTKFSFHAENISNKPIIYFFPLKSDKAILSLSEVFYQPPNSLNITRLDSAYLALHRNYFYGQNIFWGIDNTSEIQKKPEFANRKKDINLMAESIEMKNLDVEKLIFNKYFNPSQINLNDLKLNYTKYINSNNNKKFKLTDIEKKLKKQLSNKFKFFKIDRLNLRNASVAYSDHTEYFPDTFKINSVYCELHNFNPLSDKPNNNILFSNDLKLSLRNFKYELPNGLYNFSFQEAGISLANKKLYLTKGKLTPRYSKYAFAKILGKQKSRFDIDNINLEVQNLDFRLLTDHQSIKADKVKISDLTINGFKDRRLPEDTLRRPQYLVKLLKNIKKDINIKEVAIENANFYFELSSKEYNKTGNISFNSLNGTIRNITNVDSIVAKQPYMRANISSKIQNKARMQLIYRFPLDKSSNKYNFVGKIDSFNLKNLNSFTENTILLSVDKGRSNKINFHVTVYDDYAEGSMHFFYNDLKINVLDTAASKRRLSSAIANAVLPRNNPSNNFTRLKIGKIHALRIPYKSEFNLWSKALLSGAISSVYLEPAKVRARKKLIEKIQLILDKEKRKKVREQRKLRDEINNQQPFYVEKPQ